MIRITAAFLVVFAFSFPAQARHHHYKHPHIARNQVSRVTGCLFTNEGRTICSGSSQPVQSHSYAAGNDPRPHAWCGYFMRHHLGVSDRAGNLARWWAGFGTNAHEPAVGA